MKAAVSVAIGKIEIQQVPRPIPGPNEAVIKVHYCGICGSDLFGFQHGDPFSAFPHVFGHEASGEIVELGSPTQRLKIGDRVVYEITLECGKCRACREGRFSDCKNIKIIGGHLPGAFAEYVKVPIHLIYKIPDNMSYEIAALCEPYTVASRGCSRGDIKKRDNVLILGAGNIALCAIAISKEMGGKTIVAARNQNRLTRAKEFGADVLINTSCEDTYARIMELTDKEGCDVVIDATGSKAVIEDAQKYATRGGRLVIIGITADDVTFNAYNIVCKELKIIGSQNSYDQYPKIIDLLSKGKLYGKEYITDIYSYERAQEAFEYAIANTGKCGKILLRFA